MSIRRYLMAIIGGTLGVAALAVAGIAFATSYKQYQAYEKEYNEGVEKVKSGFPRLPESVFLDDDFVTYAADGGSISSSKSSHKNSYIFYARDAKVDPLSETRAQEYKQLEDDETQLGEYITGLDRMGGAITFNFETDNYGMADICIVLRTNLKDQEGNYHELENLTDYIKVSVNKLGLKTDKIAISSDREFHHLVLKDTFLIKGQNNISFSTDAYNPYDDKTGKENQGATVTDKTVLYIMPDIRNVSVMADYGITVISANAQEAQA